MALGFQYNAFQHNTGFQGGSFTPPPVVRPVGGVAKRRGRPRVPRIWVEIRDGQVYVVKDRQEAQQVIAKVQHKEKRKIRQLVKSGGPLVDLPPPPQISVRADAWAPWAVAVQEDAHKRNEEMALFYTAMLLELAERQDEEDIAAIMAYL